MKKIGKLLSVIFAAVSMFCIVGCGDKGNGGSGDTLRGSIDIILPFDVREKEALEIVAEEYRLLHPEVTVNIETISDTNGYAKTVSGIITAPNDTKGDIVQVNVVNEYYGTDKILDFTSYLSRRNPYGSDNSVWRRMLDEDAYRTEDNSHTVPALSYQSNSLVAYYNKQVFSENGWSVPTDWNSLLALLADAKTKGYTNPLGVNFNESGIVGNSFGWLMQMYADQYFRDMIDVAHSREGDYSYIEDIDETWQYDSSDGETDKRSGYTYNLSRVIDAYFVGQNFNSKSARFADMMANFYELTRFASPSYTESLSRSAFNNGVLNIKNGSQSRAESAVVYIGRMDFAADYQTSIAPAVSGISGDIISAADLAAELGCFAMPAMPDNADVEGGAPASSVLRTRGGPDHRPIGIINRGKEKNELVMDFMMYWFSERGMADFYSYYAERGLVCPLTCLVKNVTIPNEAEFADMPDFTGDCSLNPYQIFGLGYSDGIFESASGGTVRDGVTKQIRAYLTGTVKSWTGYGTAVYDKILSGFGNYAEWKRLKYSTPQEASNYFSVNPIKLSQ